MELAGGESSSFEESSSFDGVVLASVVGESVISSSLCLGNMNFG